MERRQVAVLCGILACMTAPFLGIGLILWNEGSLTDVSDMMPWMAIPSIAGVVTLLAFAGKVR